jgi:hypothetical protein
MRRVLVTALATVAASFLAAAPASASLVFDSNLNFAAQGFGNAPRSLTVQATGNATTQSGCVGVSGSGSIVVGPSGCSGVDANDPPGDTSTANGFVNTGGAEASPPTDNQKFGIPSPSSLGITSAADIGILFNATEPGGNGINVVDLTLKFFSASGTYLGAIDGSFNFSQGTIEGNGGAGFLFRVSADQQAFVNGLLATTGFLALESTMTNFSGGPESFAIVNLNAPAVPEPATWAMMLLGFGAVGFSLRSARRQQHLLQIA